MHGFDKPLLIAGAGELGQGAGEDGPGRIEAFGVLEELAGLDAQAVAALGGEQARGLDQALLAGPGHFGDRVAEGCGVCPVDAFFEASREGDFDALVEVLHPEVVLRSDGGAARPSANHVIRGAAAVAGRALTFAKLAPFVRPVLVNGVAGVLVAPQGKPFAVMAFTVAGGRVVAIDALADPARLESITLKNAE